MFRCLCLKVSGEQGAPRKEEVASPLRRPSLIGAGILQDSSDNDESVQIAEVAPPARVSHVGHAKNSVSGGSEPSTTAPSEADDFSHFTDDLPDLELFQVRTSTEWTMSDDGKPRVSHLDLAADLTTARKSLQSVHRPSIKEMTLGSVADAGFLLALSHLLPADVEALRVVISKEQCLSALPASLPLAKVKRLSLAKDRPGSMRLSHVETIASMIPGHLDVLELDLQGQTIDNEGVKVLARHIPQELKSLTLNLGNNSISSAGVIAFAKALPSTLVAFTLSLRGGAAKGSPTMAAGTDGAIALAGALKRMKELKKVSLDLTDNGVHDEGMVAIMSVLPEGVTSLTLELGANSLGSEFIDAASARFEEGFPKLRLLSLVLNKNPLGASGVSRFRFPEQIEVLKLDLGGGVFTPLKREGAIAVAKVLPRKLTILDLSLRSQCIRLDEADSDTSCIGVCLPESLTKFKFCLDDNQLGAGAEGLIRSLPRGVRHLKISLSRCGVKRPMVPHFAAALPPGLESLSLISGVGTHDLGSIRDLGEKVQEVM